MGGSRRVGVVIAVVVVAAVGSLWGCRSAGRFPELAKVDRERFGECFYRVIARHCGGPSLMQEDCARGYKARYAELAIGERDAYLVSLGCVVPPPAYRASLDAGAGADAGVDAASSAGVDAGSGVDAGVVPPPPSAGRDGGT